MLDHVSSNKMKQRGGINAGEKLEFSDLNKVSQDELQKAKGKMNKTFEQNQLKPGDHGFQYDKRVAFKTQGSSDWDEEDDDLDIDEDDLVF